MVPFNYATNSLSTRPVTEIRGDDIDEKEWESTEWTDITESIESEKDSNRVHCALSSFQSVDGDRHPMVNWISLCKRKLKEREDKLIRHRLREGSRTIELSLSQFTQQNQRFFVDLKKKTTIRVGRMDTVNHDIYRQYLPPLTVQRMAANANAAICGLLDQWDGAVFCASDATTSSFAVYFEAARLWFDEARTYLLTEHCWIPLLSLTDMIARHSATRFFHGRFSDLQRKYREYLHLLMLNNLMRCPAVSTQSGDRWLIPSASYSVLQRKLGFPRVE